MLWTWKATVPGPVNAASTDGSLEVTAAALGVAGRGRLDTALGPWKFGVPLNGASVVEGMRWIVL